MSRCSQKLLRSENVLLTLNDNKLSWEANQINSKSKTFNNLFDMGTHSVCKRMSQKIRPTSLRTGFTNLWDSSFLDPVKNINPQVSNSLHKELLLKTYLKSVLKNLNLYLNKILINKVGDIFYVRIQLYEKEITSKRQVLVNKRRLKSFYNLGLIDEESYKSQTRNLVNPFFSFTKKFNSGSWSLNKQKLINHLELQFSKKFKESLKISIHLDKNLETSAGLFANFLSMELEQSNISFKGALARTLREFKSSSNLKGIRVNCSGRLGRAPMAKTEWFKYGQVPLNTINSKLQYATSIASTKYGILGIKVWIYYR
jgi:hypothetical protein